MAPRKQWRLLTKEKKVDVVILQNPQLDTRKGKIQYGSLAADIVLSVLDYVVDNEETVRRWSGKPAISGVPVQNPQQRNR